MDLFDFFFPEQAQATHLRKLVNQGKLERRASTSSSPDVKALEEDVRFLTLLMATILRRLAETETLSLADVRDLLDEVDGLDGHADDGLDPNILRGMLGVIKSKAEHPENGPTNDEFKIDTTPRYRR